MIISHVIVVSNCMVWMMRHSDVLRRAVFYLSSVNNSADWPFDSVRNMVQLYLSESVANTSPNSILLSDFLFYGVFTQLPVAPQLFF